MSLDTLAAPASHAIDVRHSRFLANAAPIASVDDARASLREFVRRHPDTAVPDDLRPLLDE